MPVQNASDAEIAAALRRLVDDGIEAGTSVILEPEAAPHYYVQFCLDGGLVWCEAVSNQYLEPGRQLGPQELVTLEALGWREGEGEQNWFRTFDPDDGGYDAMVRLARTVLHDVYGIGAEAPLTTSCSWEGAEAVDGTLVAFASEGHRQIYERVYRHLTDFAGEAVEVDERRPAFFIQCGSAMVGVIVTPVAIHSAVVELLSWLVTEVPLTPALERFLLERNYRLPLDALGIDADGDVALRHVLLAGSIGRDQLGLALTLFGRLADQLDDEISERFGGLRAAERSP